MPRITKRTTDLIVKEQSHKKFYKQLDSSEKAILKEAVRQAKSNSPKWITKKMIESKYIKTSKHFKFEGEYTSYNRQILKIPRELPTPIPVDSSYSDVVIKKTKEILTLIKERKALLKEKKTFQADLRQVIASYGTDKKLLAAIPELQSYFANTVTALTVIPTEKVKTVRKAIKENKDNK